MGTKCYAIRGEVPYESIKIEDIDKKFKATYSRKDLGMTREVLKGFGYAKTELIPPENVKTYMQLQQWKRQLINKALA